MPLAGLAFGLWPLEFGVQYAADGPRLVALHVTVTVRVAEGYRAAQRQNAVIKENLRGKSWHRQFFNDLAVLIRSPGFLQLPGTLF